MFDGSRAGTAQWLAASLLGSCYEGESPVGRTANAGGALRLLCAALCPASAVPVDLDLWHT